MIDFTSQITSFLRENFKPSTVEKAKYKFSSAEVLDILFDTYPVNCIDAYDLNQIMESLDYKPFLMTDEPRPKIVWCLDDISS